MSAAGGIAVALLGGAMAVARFALDAVLSDHPVQPFPLGILVVNLAGTLVVGCWTQTAVVHCSGANAGTWISFTGKRTAVISWPAQSAGMKLTFQATVVAAGKSLQLRAPLMVRLP